MANPDSATPEPAFAASAALDRLEPTLRCTWTELLDQRGAQAAVARQHVMAESASGTDLLSEVLRCLNQGSSHLKITHARVAAKVRLPDYSINDLMVEVTLLARAVGIVASKESFTEAEGDALAGLVPWLQDFFFSILGETVSVYEHLIENGAIALCQLDEHGRISHVNDRARAVLGAPCAEGDHLRDCFESRNHAFIDEVVKTGERRVGNLTVRQAENPTDSPITLTVEFGPIVVLGKRAGTYAVLRDVSEWTVRERLLMDHSPLGMLKLDRARNIIYANPVALRLLGVEHFEPRPVDDILPDDIARTVIHRHIERRFHKEGSEYDLEICPPGRAEHRVPVRVAGIPLLNSEGEHEGSLGILHDRTFTVACEAIRKSLSELAEVDLAQPGTSERIERENAIDLALNRIGRIARDLAPFDRMIISRFSASGRFVRPEFQFPSANAVESGRGWYWMSDGMMKWNLRPDPEHIGDLEAFLTEYDPGLLDDAMVTSFLQDDLRSFVRIPILGQRLHAVVSFWRTGTNAFSNHDVEALSQLPVSDIVHAVLGHRDRDYDAFRFELLRKLVACKSLDEIATTLVNDIGNRFCWNHVTVFEVDSDRRELILRAQGPEDNLVWRLEEDYSQRINEGVMGKVLADDDASGINLGDVRQVPGYVGPPGDVQPLSELCMPVRWEGSARWLLNVESLQAHAFSDEEHDVLATLIREVEGVIGQMTDRYRLKAAVDTTSDAVLFISSDAQVIWLNPAASDMLGWKPDQGKRPLDDFLPDDISADSWLNRYQLPSREGVLIGTDGDRHEVYMSVSRMPREIPGWVLSAKDLEPIRRLERLEALGSLFQEVSTQAQTPMSLLFAWLQEMRDDTPRRSSIRETARHSLNQLHKIQVVLDRMALYEGHDRLADEPRLLLDLPTELARSLAQFPQSQCEAIDRNSCPVPAVLADPFQIGFVITTLLSHVTRFKRGRAPIEIVISSPGDGNVRMDITGSVPPLTAETYGDFPELASARAELRLGEATLRRFIEENHAGRFEISEQSGVTRFRMSLPAHEESAP